MFDGDSCVPTQTGYPYECVASGFYLLGGTYPGLEASSNGGSWGTSYEGVGTPPAPNDVTVGGEVSCATVLDNLPDCLIVGIHYDYHGLDVQFASWGGPNGFTVVMGHNPRGATWSSLNDVACPTSRFCMVVGSAGRKNTSHATAYIWDGRYMRELHVPAPRSSHEVELGGLACATAKTCVAVGNYQNPAGKVLSYAAIWHNGAWKLQATPNVARRKATIYNAVSCPTATYCLADGYTYLRTAAQQRTFAAVWNGAKWRLVSTPARPDTGFVGVSCPAVSACFAAGWYGSGGLIERWNGRMWFIMRTARPGAPDTESEFMHVSCVSTSACAAVGWHWSRKAQNRTLAERWNGKTWRLQSAVNS